MNNVLTKFSKEFTKSDLMEIARYEWDLAEYDPTAETFSNFLNWLKVIAK